MNFIPESLWVNTQSGKTEVAVYDILHTLLLKFSLEQFFGGTNFSQWDSGRLHWALSKRDSEEIQFLQLWPLHFVLDLTSYLSQVHIIRLVDMLL